VRPGSGLLEALGADARRALPDELATRINRFIAAEKLSGANPRRVARRVADMIPKQWHGTEVYATANTMAGPKQDNREVSYYGRSRR